MQLAQPTNRQIQPIARAGLSAKGIVYCLLGLLSFMAAFHIGGESGVHTDKGGVFETIYRQTGGQILLGATALGLVCYSIWRGVEAFWDTKDKGKDAKGLAVRARYLLSGLFYASAAVTAVRIVLNGSKDSGDSQQDFARELLSKPAGQWLAGAAALFLLGNGVYQIWYGLSEKYKKHVDGAGANRSLLLAGKVGYAARGIVWMLLAWLFGKAAIEANPAEAGDTSKAFAFLKDAAYGPYLLAAVAIGLIGYGIFNFVRARWEQFG